MKLIFLYGLPATGKLTVGQELSAITGFKVFHNHLVVDLLLTVFEFGSPEFIRLREEMWLSVLDQACRSTLPGLIFTFNPENTVRPEFIPNVMKTVAAAGAELDFVELVAPLPELKRRMGSLSRLQFKKLTSVALFEELHNEGAFEVSYMTKPRARIDTGEHQPPRAALQIARALDLLPVKDVRA